MTTGAKVALGCAGAVLLGGLVVIAGVVGLGFWAKGKVDQVTAGEQKIEALHRQADANTFTPPADGVLQEERLLKFLETRRRVFDVYVKHKDAIDAMSKQKEGGLREITQGLSILNEARLARAEGLAAVGMSQAEHDYFVTQVYKSSWASEFAKENAGQTFSQVADQAAETARKALEETRPAAEQMAREMRQRGKEMDVPPQNIALFRKHEAEIKKYAMGGLEWMGL
jgi:hypothetical protein